MADSKTDTDRTGMIQVPLNAGEVKKRAEQLAHTVREHESLESKKASHVKKWNAELSTLAGDITKLAEEVETKKAWVPKQTANDVLMGDEEPVFAQA